MTREPALLSNAVRHHGQITLLPPENLRRQRPPTQTTPRKAKPKQRPVIQLPAQQARAQADEQHIEPPPSYNEAIAWTPPVHLDTAASLVLSRDRKLISPNTKHSRSQERLAQPKPADMNKPNANRAQFDGLTKQRTRPVSSAPSNEQVVPLCRAAISRQPSQRSSRIATSQQPTKDEIKRSTSAPTASTSRLKLPIGPDVSLPTELTLPVDSSAEPPMRRPLPSLSVGNIVTSLPESEQLQPLPPLHPSLTELDLLLARIELAPDYNDMTLLNDILGKAKPQASVDELDIPEGIIEVQRRRVTNDGRVKLKLALMGTSVDRCGTCLSQFRAGEKAVMIQPCSHTAHSDCVRKWIARSATCPQCRHPLSVAGRGVLN